MADHVTPAVEGVSPLHLNSQLTKPESALATSTDRLIPADPAHYRRKLLLHRRISCKIPRMETKVF